MVENSVYTSPRMRPGHLQLVLNPYFSHVSLMPWRHHIVTCDVPGASIQVDIDELTHLKLVGEIAELLMKVNPMYPKFMTFEKGKTVIYAELSKSLYGTLQADILFHKDLTTFLTSNLGFSVNLYDWCVMNKDIKGSQCTIGWHMDDLKISTRTSLWWRIL